MSKETELHVIETREGDEGVETLLQNAMQERVYQDSKWGGPVHDNDHYPADWANIISELCDDLAAANGPQEARDSLKKIVASAVAANASIERRLALGMVG